MARPLVLAALLVAATLLAGCTGKDDAPPAATDAGTATDAGQATSEPTATSEAAEEETGNGTATNETVPEIVPGSPFDLHETLVAPLARENATFPSWRPDGAALAWMEWPDGNDTSGRVVLSATSSGVYRSFTGPKFVGSALAWNPAGTKLAVAGQDGDRFIYILDVSGNTKTKLAGTQGAAPFQWTDEGILAVSNRTGKSEVYFFHENGTIARQVTDDGLWKWAPHANPDTVASKNEFVVVVGERWNDALTPGWKEPFGKIARYDLATGDLKRIVRADADFGRPVWRNDASVSYLALDGTMHLSNPDGFERWTFARMDSYSYTASGGSMAYHPCGDGVGGVCQINLDAAART